MCACGTYPFGEQQQQRVTLLGTCGSSFHSLILVGVPEADKWQTTKMHMVNNAEVEQFNFTFQGNVNQAIGDLGGPCYQRPVTAQPAVPLKGWIPSAQEQGLGNLCVQGRMFR